MDELGVREGNVAPDGAGGNHRGPASDEGEGSTWVLQGEAAARTGFSVSAIRKWRRMGVVADRKITTPTGFERVEVKLEDVLARAAMQPERRRPEPLPTDAHAPSGSVVITIDDLEALFERMVEAERRAENAEADLESLRAQSRFTFGQISELRRQIQALAGQSPPGPSPGPEPAPSARRRPAVEEVGSAAPPPSSPPGPPPAGAAPPRPAPVPAPVPRNRVTAGVRLVRGRQEARELASPPPPTAGDGNANGPAGGGNVSRARTTQVEELTARLRGSYARLDEYRRQEVITPAAERQRQRELAEYDRVLVALCAALGIPTGVADGEPVTLKARATLTRALAQAGFDVRGDTVAPVGTAGRRPAAKRRV